MTETAGYPTPGRRLRLGMVGGGQSGLVGHWHWTGARVSARWDLVAGALSSKPEVARASGRAWNLPEDRIYSDFKEMAKAEGGREDGIDAVAICTPNHLHRPVAEAFMEAGIDIICDKPMANTLEDCAALEAQAKECGVVFAITHPYIYHPMVRQARAMIAQGALGAIRQVVVEYVQDHATLPDDRPGSVWRQDPARVGRAQTTGDIGTHTFQMLEWVTGQDVTRLRADFHVCGYDKPLEDTAFIKMDLAGGAPAMMWITQAAPGNYCGLSFRIYGDRAGLEWHQEFPEHLRFRPIGAAEQTIVRGHGAGMLPEAERMITLPRGHGEALSDAWGNLYREIAIAVEARRDGGSVPPGMLALPGIEDGTRGVRFVHAAADSHEAGGVWTAL